MEQVDSYEKLQSNDLVMSTNLASKYIKCEGEMSSLKQMWIGITSPYFSWTDIRWFQKQMNTEAFFTMEEELMDYAFFGFDLYELGTEYEVPVYYIAGEGDYALPQTEVSSYCEGLQAPDKHFVELPNVGHSLFMDNPQLFCETVKELLERTN